VAVHNVIEEVLVGEGKAQQVVSVVATNAYVKTSAGWKMVLHHASQANGGEVVSASEPHAVLH
jgi:SnoaL-like domain